MTTLSDTILDAERRYLARHPTQPLFELAQSLQYRKELTLIRPPDDDEFMSLVDHAEEVRRRLHESSVQLREQLRKCEQIREKYQQTALLPHVLQWHANFLRSSS